VSVREFVPSDDAAGLRFCLVAAQWNEAVVRRLADGAAATLRARGAAEDAIEWWWVPGSLELPAAALHAARRGRAGGAPGAPFDAVVALGCVIRGETEHFRLVADNAASGLVRVSLETGVPVTNGVLAVEDAAQADARSGGPVGNAGSQAALAAVRMANLRAGRGRA
jgi:6,7-dimethyl-8-ribityllumazine synthase